MPYASIASTQIYYRETGLGRPAVFVSGFAQDHTFWSDQLGVLGDLRRCVAVDLRGFGRSEPVATEFLDRAVYAQDLHELIRGFGDEADVVCSGMGCAVGLELWRRTPRVVASVALLGIGVPVLPRPTEGDGRGTDAYLEESARVAVEGGKSAIYQKFGSYIMSPGASLRARARYRTMVDATRYEMFVASFRAMGAWTAQLELISQIDLPVLIVTGADDSVFPTERARELFASSPHVRVTEIAGSGRLMAIEKPEATAAALREFWSS